MASDVERGLRGFILLWIGQVVSIFGSSLTGFALGVWVFQRTGSPTLYGLLTFFATVPALLSSPYAGALVDRWDRRLILIFSDTCSGIATAAIAFLLWSGDIEIWHLYLILGLGSLLGAAQWPAFSASIALLVPRQHYGRASGLIQLGPAASQILAPLLGGVLLVTIGLTGVILIDFSTFLFAIFTLLVIRIPRVAAPATAAAPAAGKTAAGRASSRLLSEARLGWEYIKERPGLLHLLLLFAAANFTSGMVIVLFAPLVLSFATADVLGWVLAVCSLGALLGSVTMGLWGGPRRRIPGIFLFLFVQGSILLLGGVRPNAVLISVAGFVSMFSGQFLAASSQALWLAKVPVELQGRVFAIRRMVALSTLPLAFLIAGPLAEYVFEPLLAVDGALADSVGRWIGTGPGRGIGLMLFALAFLVMGAVAAGLSSRRLRTVDDLPDAAPPATERATAPPQQAPGEAAVDAAPEVAPGELSTGELSTDELSTGELSTGELSTGQFLRRAALALAALLGVLLLIAGGLALWLRDRVVASLPRLAGDVAVSGLTAPVTVARDGLGIPTIHGANRRDVAFALGFVHAQDRFFQMDLQRRRAAGELAEILGPPLLDHDRVARLDRFRDRARQAVAAASPELREAVEAYAAGVNAGLADLGASPFEYVVLRTEPQPWRPEDSALTIFAMYQLFHRQNLTTEVGIGLMHDLLPPPLFEFLTPRGTSWDTPLFGEPLATPPIPGPEVLDLRRPAQAAVHEEPRVDPLLTGPSPAGSNSWAVAGAFTASGVSLLANDTHLPLQVPNIWYRAAFAWPGPDGVEQRVTGVTLPGTPIMVLGSNGHVAWGLTNAGVDLSDMVVLDEPAAGEDVYLTPAGPRPFEHETEVIRVKGSVKETLEVTSTVWGPVFDTDHRGRRRALRWVAYEPGAVNFEYLHLETARTAEEALAVANRSGMPAQNFVAADDAGHVGWTLAGKLPARTGCDGTVPRSWADSGCRWEGLLPPDAYPRLVDPESGRLWTANNRLVEGEMLTRVGDGGYVSGARARQIRDRLLSLERASEPDMVSLQLDDRALFLSRWRQLWLDALSPEALAADPRRRELRRLIEDWGGHAAVDSVGYRLVRGARLFLSVRVFDALTAPCREADEDFVYINSVLLHEGPLWRLVSEQPPHLLSPRVASWDELFLSTLDQLVSDLAARGGELRDQTWGRFNTVRIRHPLSQALPGASRWIDLPAVEQPGDNYMPRVQLLGFGASQRMVVSPGREAEGYFHMPGGQSGHPLSPHFQDAHAAWAQGEPTPFLPGPTAEELRLRPAAASAESP